MIISNRVADNLSSVDAKIFNTISPLRQAVAVEENGLFRLGKPNVNNWKTPPSVIIGVDAYLGAGDKVRRQRLQQEKLFSRESYYHGRPLSEYPKIHVPATSSDNQF